MYIVSMPPRKNVYKRDSIMFYFDGEKEKTIDKVNFCNKCHLERIINRAETSYVCINCGYCEFVFFPAVNYRDMSCSRIRQYSYKRLNYLKVRLRRFQAVESENVPKKVYDIIKRDLLKRRIRWDGVGPMPTLTNIIEILKNNKLTIIFSKYIAATPKLTGKEEERIIEMFHEVERSYRKYINRYNFFIYIYVLNKILRILKKEEHEKYFKLLKCRWKLQEYDNVWRKIFIEKGWEFYSSL